MKRRDFLKTSAMLPFLGSSLLTCQSAITSKYQAATRHRFEFLEVQGSYKDIGYQVGKYLGKNIQLVIERQKDWHQKLLNILGTRAGQLRSAEYQRLTRQHFPYLLDEIEGMAEGAGVAFDAIWAMCIKSELQAMEPAPTDCSTIFYHAQNRQWLFHNEDGNKAYSDAMFMLKATPPSGVTYLSMVYPGIITGNGPTMNSRGIIQTTNYIGSTESSIGIPRYILGRASIEAQTLQEAIDILTFEPRAYPYHHNLGSISDKKYISLETTPDTWEMKQPEGTYCHTNHLLFDKTASFQAEDQKYKESSSMSRYNVVSEELPNLNPKNPVPSDFLNILASHRNAPYSPCRHPEGNIAGQTLGTAFFDFETGRMRLFKGNPCVASSENLFQDFLVDQLKTMNLD